MVNIIFSTYVEVLILRNNNVMCALGACVFVIAGQAIAGPVITAVSGEATNGSTIQISGSKFGSTGNELPLKFDDFESGTVGANLNTGGWSTDSSSQNPDPQFSKEYAYSGSQSGYADIREKGDSGAFIRGLNSETAYVSLMFRYVIDSGDPATTKGVRLHADDGPNVYSSYPGMFVQDFYSRHRISIKPTDDGGDSFSTYQSVLSQNKWMRKEYYFKISTPAGSSNGQILSWVDGALKDEWEGVNRLSGVSDIYQLVMMPFYIGNGGGGRFWYDDVYISKSRARVEVCKNASWSACNTRSIQVPMSWNGTSITAKLNLAGLDGLGDLYLYVIDGDGVVSASFLLGSAPIGVESVLPLAPQDFTVKIL